MYNNDYSNLIKSASYLSVITAISIIFIKGYGWISTDSQSILASLVDSMLDISASLINLFAIRIALKPADDNHRFGHEKFQDIAIFSQSIFFFCSSIFILVSSTKDLISSNHVTNAELGAEVMYICLGLTTILVGYQTYVVHKTKSAIIAADKLHYFSDFMTNIFVIISLYLSDSFWYTDSVAGILISIYMIHGSYTLFKKALCNLVDEEFPQADKDKIISIVKQFEAAKGIHELKTRSAAEKSFIQFHLDMDASLSLREAHNISENIIIAISKEFPKAEIMIHQDPEGEEEKINFRENF